MTPPLLVVDVAHPPRHPDIVESELLDALRKAQNSPSVRVLKVIHGYGSSGKGGQTRETVRNWWYVHRQRIRRMIPGESYSLSDPDTVELRQLVGDFPDPDLGTRNSGITVIWIR
jgi:hypothetical protein